MHNLGRERFESFIMISNSRQILIHYKVWLTKNLHSGKWASKKGFRISLKTIIQTKLPISVNKISPFWLILLVRVARNRLSKIINPAQVSGLGEFLVIKTCIFTMLYGRDHTKSQYFWAYCSVRTMVWHHFKASKVLASFRNLEIFYF